MKNRILLTDGDIFAYRAAAVTDTTQYEVRDSAEDAPVTLLSRKDVTSYVAQAKGEVSIEHHRVVQPIEFTLHLVKESMNALLEYLGGTLEVWLSPDDGSNFRKSVATILPYKGNRNALNKPTHLPQVRQYLVDNWGAQVAEGEEADDRLGIRQTEERSKGNEESIIVSIDKDLDQIPGKHYNHVKGKAYEVKEREALRSLYEQILTGDSTDNIRGIAGVGPVTAKRATEPYTTEHGLARAVRDEWRKAYPEGVAREGMSSLSADDAMLETGRLVYIRRQPGELWQSPVD